MKKVVMFGSNVHEIPPTKGAAVQTWIDETSKKLLKYQTHIISISHPFYPNKEFKDGVFFHRIHLSKVYKRIFQKILGWDIYSYNKRVFNIIKKINPDIIHIHNYYGSKEIIRWIKEFNKDTKIILHMHNLSKSFDKLDFPKIDMFIGCSQFIVESFKDKINANRYEVVYNGVDNEKYQNAIKYEKILRKEKSIFYFGRVSEEKGVDKIIEIAKLLKNEEYKIYCIGEISTDGKRRKYYDNLLNIIKKNNLDNITFFDYISAQKIHLAYQMADMIIVPSKIEEAFGMIVIEAMASGVPTICVYKGGMKEYLEDNKNSMIIFDYQNFAKESVNKIKLLENKEIYNKIKYGGFETAQKFDWLNIAQTLEGLYDELCY